MARQLHQQNLRTTTPDGCAGVCHRIYPQSRSPRVAPAPPPVPAPPVNRDKPLRDKPVGITLVTRYGITRWQAQLTHNGRNFYLGTHVTADAAARAYDAKARDLGW